MAADQRKKPVTTVKLAATSHDHTRLKKNNNLGLVPSSRSKTVSLEWDDKNNSVVAKREQIGLSQRHLVSIGSYVSHHHPNVLADVLTLPREIFELDIVKEILSYEVWQTLLSEKERQYLMQFLPEGVDMHNVVQELLVGHSNFHFANPFLEWISSLCSGNLHPDAIGHQERCIRASKKTYFAALVKYHNGMINNLRMWKERWASSMNPEEEIVQKLWRPRKQAGNPSDLNEYKICKGREDVAGSSESGSSSAEENAGSSDNQNLVTRHRELRKGKVTAEDRFNNSAAGHKGVERSKKGQKQIIPSSDGSKYMSYIKVSRKQHQRIKSSMKHSSNSIQSRSLNHVLGGLHKFQIQPFEVFEEEERKRLHSHWLQLAVKDVPASFANFRRWQLAKSRLPHMWKHEMKEKFVSLNEAADQADEKDNTYIVSPDIVDDGASRNEVADAMEIDEEEQSGYLLREEHSDYRAKADKQITLAGVVKKAKSNSIVVEEVMDVEEDRVETEASKHDSQFTRASMLLGQDQQKHPHQYYTEEFRGLSNSITCAVEADTDSYLVREKRDDGQLNASDYSPQYSKRASITNSSNFWPTASIRNSSYHHHHPTQTQNFNTGSAAHLLSHPEEQSQCRLSSLDNDNDDGVAGGNHTWHTQSQSVNGSFVVPYSFDQGGVSGGHNELLHHHHHHHRFMGPDTLMYHHNNQELKKHGQFGFEQQLQASSLSASSGVGRSEYIAKLREQLNMPPPLNNQIDASDQIILGERLFAAAADVEAEGFSYNNILPAPLMMLQQQQTPWSNLEPSSSSHVVTGISNMDERCLYRIGRSHEFSNMNDNSSYNNNTGLPPYAAQFDSLVVGPSSPIQSSVGFGGVSPSSIMYRGGGVPMTSSSLSLPIIPPLPLPLPLVYNPAAIREDDDSSSSMMKPFLGTWNS